MIMQQPEALAARLILRSRAMGNLASKPECYYWREGEGAWVWEWGGRVWMWEEHRCGEVFDTPGLIILTARRFVQGGLCFKTETQNFETTFWGG